MILLFYSVLSMHFHAPAASSPSSPPYLSPPSHAFSFSKIPFPPSFCSSLSPPLPFLLSLHFLPPPSLHPILVFFTYVTNCIFRYSMRGCPPFMVDLNLPSHQTTFVLQGAHGEARIVEHPWRSTYGRAPMVEHPRQSIHGGALTVEHPCWTQGGASMLEHPQWRTQGGAPMSEHPWWSTQEINGVMRCLHTCFFPGVE